jgi:hypothetical protein
VSHAFYSRSLQTAITRRSAGAKYSTKSSRKQIAREILSVRRHSPVFGFHKRLAGQFHNLPQMPPFALGHHPAIVAGKINRSIAIRGQRHANHQTAFLFRHLIIVILRHEILPSPQVESTARQIPTPHAARPFSRVPPIPASITNTNPHYDTNSSPISTSRPGAESPRRVPHSAFLSGVGGLVAARGVSKKSPFLGVKNKTGCPILFTLTKEGRFSEGWEVCRSSTNESVRSHSKSYPHFEVSFSTSEKYHRPRHHRNRSS